MRPQPIDDLDAGCIGGCRRSVELGLQRGILADPVHAARQPERETVSCGELEHRAEEASAGHEPVDRTHVIVEVRHVDAGVERGQQLGGEFGGDIVIGGVLLDGQDVGREEARGVDEARGGTGQRAPPVAGPFAGENEVHADVEVGAGGGECERCR